MAGLLPNNPFSQWVDPRRNALMGFSAGMLSGDPGAAMRYAMQGSGIDRDAAMQAQQQAQAEQERNATMEWVKQNAPQFANLPPAMAFEAAMKQLNEATGPEMTANMRDFMFAQENPDYATFLNPPKAPAMPTSYQEYLLAQQDPNYAANLNSSTSKPPTEGQRRNTQLSTVAEPLLKSVEENWAALTDPGNQMVGANTPLGAPGFALTTPEYQKAQNAIRTIAQSYLYSVSGAAATDAETQKIVESVTPRFGESEASANEKKALLRRMVESIKAAGGGSATSPAGATEPQGMWVYNPATGRLEQQ